MKTRHAREIREGILYARDNELTAAWLVQTFPGTLFERAYARTRARIYRVSPLRDEETQTNV